MGSEEGYLKNQNLADIPEEIGKIMPDFSEDFDIEKEYESIIRSRGNGRIERVMQEYLIELDNTGLSSQIHIFDTPIEAEEILSNTEMINYETYRNIVESRDPTGETRILYFMPDEHSHKPLEYDRDELELIYRFNDELEFLAMADGKVNFGEKYLHVFDLTD